ncbi:MAG: hypothetical protein U9R38_05470 [Candidatus Margulisiibacteriota bacterium]|nr:hypothetical protein [Candidatus Margulisiibacteriota bacterium]
MRISLSSAEWGSGRQAWGGAYTAVADDGSAVFYNPAGLAVPGFQYTFGNPDSGNVDVDGSFEFVKLGYVGYGQR